MCEKLRLDIIEIATCKILNSHNIWTNEPLYALESNSIGHKGCSWGFFYLKQILSDLHRCTTQKGSKSRAPEIVNTIDKLGNLRYHVKQADYFGEKGKGSIIWMQQKEVSLKTINKQGSNSTNTSHQSNDDPNWRQPSTNNFSGGHIIQCKPLLWCSTLRAYICIRLQKKEKKKK